VHSVFLHACNMEWDSGELITLLAPRSGKLPHGIRCASQFAPLRDRLRRGQAATLERGILRVPGAQFMVDLSRAAIWDGSVVAFPGLCGAQSLPALGVLRELLSVHALELGIAPVLLRARRPHSMLEHALAARMAEALPMLARATETNDAPAVNRALSALVGLGAGLTPAGDDFIVGYLAALWSRSRRERRIGTLLRELDSRLGQLSLHTNAVSRQLLLDAVHGQFAERLAEAVRCICCGGDVAGATLRALEVGHSSGADTLCGLLFGYAPLQGAGPVRASATGFHFHVRYAAHAATSVS